MRLNSANRIHVLPEILKTYSFWFIVGSVISTVYNYNLNLDILHKQNKKSNATALLLVLQFLKYN